MAKLHAYSVELSACKVFSLEANPTKFQSMLLKNKKATADDFDTIVNDTMLNLTDDI